MKAIVSGLVRNLRGAGPYLLIELLLPGGTLLALLLWLTSGAGRGYFAVAPEPVFSAAAIECVVSPGRDPYGLTI